LLHGSFIAPLFKNLFSKHLACESGNACIALEAGHSFRIARERLGKKFQRNLAVQIEVVGRSDFAHASTSQLLTDMIMA